MCGLKRPVNQGWNNEGCDMGVSCFKRGYASSVRFVLYEGFLLYLFRVSGLFWVLVLGVSMGLKHVFQVAGSFRASGKLAI